MALSCTYIQITMEGLVVGTLEPGTFWSGLIDDVRIYDVALSAEEIETLVQ